MTLLARLIEEGQHPIADKGFFNLVVEQARKYEIQPEELTDERMEADDYRTIYSRESLTEFLVKSGLFIKV